MRHYDGWDEEESGPQRPSPFQFFDFLRFARDRQRFILFSSLVLAVVVFSLSFLIKDTYESIAVILPPRPDQSASALLSGVGGLSSLAAGGTLSAVSLKNPNEVYTSLLESRTLNTNIVKQFNLEAYYHRATMQDTIKALKKHVSIELSKDNLIRIAVRTHDANFSSQVANAFVDQLHSMNTELALTDSAQRRLFYQEQLDQEKVLLAKAEADLQETQIKTGVIQPIGQADMISRTISSLHAQITEREAQLQAMKTFDAPENPEYMKLHAEIESLQAQLGKLRNGTTAQAPGDIEVPTANLPKSAMEYARKFRDVQQHEQVYALLLKQFEAAKIDEAKTAPVIEVVDRAVPSELPSNLPHWAIGLLGFGVSLLLNGLWLAGAYVLRVLRAGSVRLESSSIDLN